MHFDGVTSRLTCLVTDLSRMALTVVDDDGDAVRCRWAEASRQECASVCHSLSPADVTLNQVSLILILTGSSLTCIPSPLLPVVLYATIL